LRLTLTYAFPGGGGYGNPAERDKTQVKRDLAGGYISASAASEIYGLSAADIDAVISAVRKGETI